jgi:hypothetical protein
MHRRVCLLICLATLTVLMAHSRAAAYVGDRAGDRDEYRDDVRLYGGLGLGFGGKLETDATGPLGLLRVDSDDDLITTVGGQVGVDVPVLRYLSLGAEARIGAINGQTLDDRGVDRSKLIDLDFKPRLTLPLRRSPLEFYFTVPIGLTIPILADDFGDGDAIDAKLGWNLGVGAGLNFWLTHRLALNVEPMYLMHWFDLDLPAGSGSVKVQQFSLFLNAVFAL